LVLKISVAITMGQGAVS